MEMYQLEAVLHAAFFEYAQGFEQFGRIEAEFALVAAALGPFARAGAGELDTYADVGTYAEAFGYVGDKPQFVQLFHHQVYTATHLLGQQCQLDIALVLVSVADYQGIGVGVGGQDGVQFGLGSGFEADIEFGAVAHNFLHDLAHLIYLDGVYHIILCRVSVAGGCFAEAVRNFLDTVVQNVRKAQQYGRCQVAFL